jgi:hypothetical protein
VMTDMTKETLTVRIRLSAVAVTLLALTACGQGPGDAARVAMEAAVRGQTAEVLERVDPEIKARKAQAKGGGTSVVVEKVDQTDADHAVVTTITRFGNGSTQTDTGKVRRVDGK